MMRAPVLAGLLALLALAPLAQASPLPPLDHGSYVVGPCHASWGFNVDAESRAAGCSAEGIEVFDYADSMTLLGHSCHLRVLGQTLEQCSPGTE